MPSTKVASAGLAAGAGGLAWSVQSTNFTAVANNGYYVNTTSAAITITLPATPSAGNSIGIVDYSGTFDTNPVIINPNSNKINGGTDNLALTGEREGVTLNYIDATQGWLCNSGINEGTRALQASNYSIDFLVIAGGGAGGEATGVQTIGGGGGAGGFRTSTQTATVGTNITVTVGSGGAVNNDLAGSNGSDSSISGTGLTTITSAGGGGGAGGTSAQKTGLAGGSGGGGGGFNNAPLGVGGAGNTPSTSPSQGNNGGAGFTARFGAGGGGGSGAVGNTDSGGGQGGLGGVGTANSITGSSVTRAGGGVGGGLPGAGVPTNNAGGGGTSSTAGTVNTGGGGGGAYNESSAPAISPQVAGSGGKGIVILGLPTTNYSGYTTGDPTVTTFGSNTILQFTGDGSYIV